jgi:fructan beta-fructosidase
MRDGKYPDMPFNQQMTFPCDLVLRTLGDSPHLFRRPAREIERLHRREHTWTVLAPASGETRVLDVEGDLFRILAEVEIPEGSALSFRLRGVPVTLTDRTVACKTDPAPVHDRVRRVEILVDRTSIEVFANDGEVSIAACFLPVGNRLEVAGDRGAAQVRSLRVFELKSIWDSGADVR